MSDLAVVDSHVLVWAGQGELRKLGRGARRVLERAEAGRAGIYIPTLVLAEIGEGVHRGTIRIGCGFEDWVAGLLSSPHYMPADLTASIVLRAQALYQIPERSDRLIAATAQEIGVPLITRDPEIRRVAGVETIW